MIFRQLFDADTWTYTYLLADEDTRDAVLIDTVFEKHARDLAMLRELELELRYTLDTHVHADHVTGAWLMQQATTSKIVMMKASGAEGADLYLEDGDTVRFGSHALVARATPGHTDGCVTYVLDDESTAFTGDALLVRGAGRTDFQQGDPGVLFRSVREKILTLPNHCMLWPAHDYSGRTSTSVREERQHNPRLGDGVREEDFVGYMNNLGLPHPKRLDVAVPANLKVGRPDDGRVPGRISGGPVVRTFAGVPELDAEWVHLHMDELTFVDVREREELAADPLGQLPGSVVNPLSGLRQNVEAVPKGKPVVTVCASGARSAQAAVILEEAGIAQVANLTGGVLRWGSLGFPMVESQSTAK